MIYSSNTSSGYIQSGAGTVYLESTGGNDYLGATYLNGGVAEISSDSQLGGTLNSNTNMNGGTLVGNYTGDLDNGTHNIAADEHPVVLGNNGGGLAATAGNTLTVDGTISGGAGTGPLVIGIPASSNNGSVLGQLPGTGTGTANASVLATGVVVFSNAGNTYAGGTVLDSGTLQLASGSSLGTGAVTFNGGAFQWGIGSTADISTAGITATSLGGTIDTNGNTVTLGGVITGPGGITVTSSLANGNLKLGGASTYTGATNVAAGTLTLNSGASLGNTAITVASTLAANPGSGNIQIGSTGATLSLAAGATLDLTNGSSNTGTLTLNSTGAGLGTVLDLSGGTTASPNTLTFGIGSTGADELIVNDGVVNFAASNPQTTIKLASFAGAAPSTLLLPLLYDPNATNFSLSDFSLFAASSPITNFTGGDYVVTLTLNGTTNELFADLTQAVVNLNFYWTGAQGSTTWATIGNFATDTSGTQAQTGSLGGTSNVFETGTDAANFSGSYSPQTVGANTINSLTFTGAVASSLTLGSGTLTIDADSAFTDTNNSNNYATGIGLVVESGAAANTISANINLGASQTWEIDSANALTVSGTIAGATESLTKTGVGTLILSGSNTYAGGTTVSAGKIQLSSGGSIGSAGTLTVQGTGTFDLAGNNQTVGGLSDGGVSTGTITSSVGSATLLVNTSVPAAFSGTITDGGSGNSLSLTFAGPSTETLSGYNSYTGLTTVTGGTLIAAINSALGSSTSATGGLLLNPSSGTATVDFTSANPAIASLASSGGGTSDIVLGSTGSGGTSTTLTITGAGAGSGTTFSGVISDQTGTVATAIGNLTLSGGTLTLGGANTFTGTTIISSGGTLVLGNALALQDSTLNYNNQGGTLSLGSLTALTLAGLTGAQNLALTNTNSVAVALTIGNGVADNYTGSLSGAGSSLTKVGADTLTLSNANYTGATTVNAGSLTISGGSVGSPTSALTINVAGVGLNLTGGTLTAGTVDVGITGGATGAAVSITGAASASFASLQIGSSANTGGAFTINTTGTVSLGNYILGRDGGSGGGLDTAAGLIIDAGTVTATTIAGGSGVGGRSADINISGGTFTIGTSASTGAFELGGTGAVGSDYLTQTGGSLTYLGTDGLVAGALAGTTSGISITGATTVDTLTGVTLNSANSNTTVAALTVGTNATLYLGSVGLVENLPGLSGTGVAVNFGTAKVGAIAPWSSAAAINLTGNTTFQAADANSNPNNITLSGTLSGTGGLTVSGPGVVTLSGSNTYAGATAVSAGGTLVVSGSIGGSAATVSGAGANMEVDNVVNPGINVTGGGMLSGVGTVDGSATVSGGTLAPGLTLANSTSAVGALTSNGNVTLGSSSTFSIRIGLTDGSSGDVDSLNVPTGSFNLTDGTTTLQLNAGVAENGATLDTIYTIVNGGASLTGVSGDWFANAPGQGDEITTATGYQFDVFYAVAAGSTTDPGSDINVELIAVPEPGTWASLLGGIGILVAWQRSRRRRG
jgi:autotransporter-associated beta strand protein